MKIRRALIAARYELSKAREDEAAGITIGGARALRGKSREEQYAMMDPEWRHHVRRFDVVIDLIDGAMKSLEQERRRKGRLRVLVQRQAGRGPA